MAKKYCIMILEDLAKCILWNKKADSLKKL